MHEEINEYVMIWAARICDFETCSDSRHATEKVDGVYQIVVSEKQFSTFGQISIAFARQLDEHGGALSLQAFVVSLIESSRLTELRCNRPWDREGGHQRGRGELPLKRVEAWVE